MQYAKSYIDQVCDSNDVFGLYNIVTTLGQARPLPEALKVFVRLWDWCCMTRSGIWQYYECCHPAFIEETATLFRCHHLEEIARRYETGLTNWQAPHYCGDLDNWIDDNWDVLEETALNLVKSNLESLYPASL